MRITNAVVQGDLGCRIDLKELVLKLSNVRYQPQRFSGIVWQHRKIGGNYLVFFSGKLNCAGKCSTVGEGIQRLRRYPRFLQRSGYPVKLCGVRVITTSATHQLNVTINPRMLQEGRCYEPEIFAGLMFYRDDLHYICHLSGKVMITGIKKKSDLDNIYPVILELELCS
jgi:TATA-box binding protein (TBP) (component of TFIID and TFIIIB)